MSDGEQENLVTAENVVDLVPKDAPEADDAGDAEVVHEIEYKGQKYPVDPAVKEAYEAMQGETTKKFQEAANERKRLEEEWTAHQERIRIQSEIQEDVTEVKLMDRQLAQYQQVDWARWRAQDKDAAEQAFFEYNMLKNKRTDAVTALSQKAQAAIAKDRERQAQRRAEVQKTLPTKIKDWSPDRETQLKQFVMKEYGLSEAKWEALADDPGALQMANYAFINAQAALKAKVQPPPAITPTPVPKASGSAPAKKGLSDNLSQKEWSNRFWAERKAHQNRR